MSGDVLFVASAAGLGEYDAVTGALINKTILGPSMAGPCTACGDTLFVIDCGGGTLGS